MRDVVVLQSATCLLSLQFHLKTTLTVVSHGTLASVGAPIDSCFSLPWLFKGRQNAEDLSCGGTLKI